MGPTAFLVDGFNLYHSVVEAQIALGGASTRWLDLRSLCLSYLPHIGRTARPGPVYYFSALARHRQNLDPQVTARHRFPDVPVFACFPYNRQSLELKAASSGCFRITKEAYARHQLPDPFVLAGGRSIWKPSRW